MRELFVGFVCPLLVAKPLALVDDYLDRLDCGVEIVDRQEATAVLLVEGDRRIEARIRHLYTWGVGVEQIVLVRELTQADLDGVIELAQCLVLVCLGRSLV